MLHCQDLPAPNIGRKTAPRGLVLLHGADGNSFTNEHDRASRLALGQRLARLKGYEFAGDHDAAASYGAPTYLLPSDTLIGQDLVSKLGIRNEHDLFGGVVPRGFIATKAITHPLIDVDAAAPQGWSHDFDRRIHDAVPFGFTAFSLADARRAGLHLLERGPARLKPVHATAGRGQVVFANRHGLEAVLAELEEASCADGLVLEENLTDVTTFSVGQVRVADLVASYFGTQHVTPDNGGNDVYGGSDLTVMRGSFADLLKLDMPDDIRTAVQQACLYDKAASELYPGLIASRRNYDVAHGLASSGRWRSGVLEQSWRMGGASSAEIGALEAFAADPVLRAVRASSVEIYGDSENPPAHAAVYFRGDDPEVGPLTKYAVIEEL